MVEHQNSVKKCGWVIVEITSKTSLIRCNTAYSSQNPCMIFKRTSGANFATYRLATHCKNGQNTKRYTLKIEFIFSLRSSKYRHYTTPGKID